MNTRCTWCMHVDARTYDLAMRQQTADSKSLVMVVLVVSMAVLVVLLLVVLVCCHDSKIHDTHGVVRTVPGTAEVYDVVVDVLLLLL